jgi:hypothetical protein
MTNTSSEDDDDFVDDDVILIKDDTIPFSQQHCDIGRKLTESQTQSSIGIIKINKSRPIYAENFHRNRKRRKSILLASSNDTIDDTPNNAQRSNRDDDHSDTSVAPTSNNFRDLEKLLDMQQSDLEYNDKENVDKHKTQSCKEKINRTTSISNNQLHPQDEIVIDKGREEKSFKQRKRKSTEDCTSKTQSEVMKESIYNGTSKSTRPKSAEKHTSIVHNRNSIVGSRCVTRSILWFCSQTTHISSSFFYFFSIIESKDHHIGHIMRQDDKKRLALVDGTN